MKTTINCRVLLVEDDPSDAHLVQSALRIASEISFEIIWVTTLGAIQPQLFANLPELLLLDLSLPDSNGLETLKKGRQLAGTLPIIVLTGHDDTGFALQTLEAGAQDYIVKGSFDSDSLVRSIRYAISRTKLEQRLHESEQRMTLALSGAQLGLWDWHIPSGKVIFSELWAQMLGYTLDELAPDVSSWEKLVHPDDLAMVEAILQLHLRGEIPIYRSEHRLLHKNKSWVWVLDIGQVLERSADGQPLRAVGIHQNISHRKHAEARDRLLISALKAVSYGIVITNVDAEIEWANPAFEKMTGYSIAESIGKKPSELVKSGQQDEAFYHALWSHILAGENWCGELINKRKDGSLYAEELTITPVADEKGKICHFVAIKQDITERKRTQEQLWEMATTDFLTGLINRRYFMVKLEEEFARAQRYGKHEVSVLMLDIDYFKRVNDTYGHPIGDALLKHFTLVIQKSLRKTDIAGRLGGEEFSIVLPDTPLYAARVFAERLCQEVKSSPLHLDNTLISVTVSIGIAAMEESDNNCDAVLIRADDALYKAKEAGRNRVEIAIKHSL
jgi:diguanylate cyclase (GGDEF)-like protein/PAS domain S-box-containing protein